MILNNVLHYSTVVYDTFRPSFGRSSTINQSSQYVLLYTAEKKSQDR